MAMIPCPSCGEMISDKSNTCIHCGFELSSPKKVCPECGTELDITATTCPKCGCPLTAAAPSSAPVEVTVSKNAKKKTLKFSKKLKGFSWS